MNEQGQFLLYTGNDGAVKVEVFVRDETVWLTQKALAELFAVKVPAINKHLKNIFESGELAREATVSKMEIVRADVAREVEFYNLDGGEASPRRHGDTEKRLFGHARFPLPRRRCANVTQGGILAKPLFSNEKATALCQIRATVAC